MSILTASLGGLALLSLALTLWQWVVARRFPLHQRPPPAHPAAPVTVLKPVHGADPETARCLESWLTQLHAAPIQILFGVAHGDDLAVPLVEELIRRHPSCDARLIVCPDPLGANAKVSTLAQLYRHALHPVLVISDADVRVTPDFLTSAVSALGSAGPGLISCLYRLSPPRTLAMEWESVAVNADFWSQVLQARSLGPMDFALGATIVARQECLAAAGGFEALVDYLADDYQLGHRAAGRGFRLDLCPVPVECHEPLAGWREAWNRQLRWARTVRFCKPFPYFCSLLGNATLWPLLLLLLGDTIPSARIPFEPTLPPTAALATPWVDYGNALTFSWTLPFFMLCLVARVLTALSNRARIEQAPPSYARWWMIPIKDLLQVVLWALAFTGNRIVWRHRRYQIRAAGRLEPVD